MRKRNPVSNSMRLLVVCYGAVAPSHLRLRSERFLLEQLNDNMLYRWFVGVGADDPIWHHSSFSKIGPQ